MAARLAAGDDHALVEVFDALARSVYGSALRVVGDTNAAQDVVQAPPRYCSRPPRSRWTSGRPRLKTGPGPNGIPRRGVEGDIDHPARLGDHIIEHVTIAGIEGTGTWTVVEHDRPLRVALETELAVGRLRISYQLAAVAGGTRFQRDLDYPDLGPQIAAVMEAQSRAGVAGLAALVERHIPA